MLTDPTTGAREHVRLLGQDHSIRSKRYWKVSCPPLPVSSPRLIAHSISADNVFSSKILLTTSLRQERMESLDVTNNRGRVCQQNHQGWHRGEAETNQVTGMEVTLIV